jgi:hypothetical protein
MSLIREVRSLLIKPLVSMMAAFNEKLDGCFYMRSFAGLGRGAVLRSFA